MTRHVAMLAPMPSELRPVIRALRLTQTAADATVYEGSEGTTAITAMRTGMGMAAATKVTDRILDRARPDHLMVVGIAGSIGDDFAIGEVIVPATVIDGSTGREYRPSPLQADTTHKTPRGALHTSDELITDQRRLADLASTRGVIALDMETAAVAAVCERRGCPWSVFRAISDRACDGMVNDAVFKMAGPDGAPRPAAVAMFVLRHPNRISDLVRLGRDLQKATSAAAAAAIDALKAV